ncbi:N-acetylglucosamine-6-phosphate deacetylase [Shewanella litorisediminis]|uniref:N-acetylglucosamine-6-phosphate deacetylase n=2 Tax=Shewanella litorisediminis TaxID=1173586 RepID=A0ABX7G8B2_9GAMM|nr:N-acetylglucosamine-6-phosphate deacetylase [Shewanella litorisediminis]
MADVGSNNLPKSLNDCLLCPEFALLGAGKESEPGSSDDDIAALVSAALVPGLWLKIRQGRIETIAREPDADLPHYRLPGILAPALIDTQVNGGGGVLINHQPTAAGINTLTQTHGLYGTGALLPTVISDNLAVMSQALEGAIAARQGGDDAVVGIHFEGPHLSLAKKGCHSPALIRPIGEAEFALYAEAVSSLGCCMVTLAPEAVSPNDVARLVALGVRVSLGHSNADVATVEASLAAGASGFTHLFNGMSGLQGREPGMVGAALASPDAYCGIILDGEHVHATSANLAWRLKGTRRLMLVTDAMSPTGTREVSFEFFGGRVHRDGMVLRDEHGSLAGSVLTMTAAVRQACAMLGVSAAEALWMATATPAAFLGLKDRGRLAPNCRADFVLLDDALYQLGRWQAGQLVAGKEPILE